MKRCRLLQARLWIRPYPDADLTLARQLVVRDVRFQAQIARNNLRRRLHVTTCCCEGLQRGIGRSGAAAGRIMT